MPDHLLLSLVNGAAPSEGHANGLPCSFNTIDSWMQKRSPSRLMDKKPMGCSALHGPPDAPKRYIRHNFGTWVSQADCFAFEFLFYCRLTEVLLVFILKAILIDFDKGLSIPLYTAEMVYHINVQSVYAIVRHSSQTGAWTDEKDQKDRAQCQQWIDWYWTQRHPKGCNCQSEAVSEAVTLFGESSSLPSRLTSACLR